MKEKLSFEQGMLIKKLKVPLCYFESKSVHHFMMAATKFVLEADSLSRCVGTSCEVSK